MFNLKKRLLDQEIMICRLREDLKFTCHRASVAETKLKQAEGLLTEYQGVTKEELKLEAQLRVENLKTEIARTQIDKQKEIAEAFDVKPKAFK